MNPPHDNLPLAHELFNDAMKGRPLEMKGFAFLTLALFASTQGQKVLRRLGCNVHVQLHDNSSHFSSTVRDIDCVYKCSGNCEFRRNIQRLSGRGAAQLSLILTKHVRILSVRIGNKRSFLVAVQVLLE